MEREDKRRILGFTIHCKLIQNPCICKSNKLLQCYYDMAWVHLDSTRIRKHAKSWDSLYGVLLQWLIMPPLLVIRILSCIIASLVWLHPLYHCIPCIIASLVSLHPLYHCIPCSTDLLSLSFSHSLSLSLILSLTLSLSHSLTHSLSLILSLTHSLSFSHSLSLLIPPSSSYYCSSSIPQGPLWDWVRFLTVSECRTIPPFYGTTIHVL